MLWDRATLQGPPLHAPKPVYAMRLYHCQRSKAANTQLHPSCPVEGEFAQLCHGVRKSLRPKQIAKTHSHYSSAY